MAASTKELPRRSRGRAREGASFPAAPPRSELPSDYVETLAEIKRRVQKERLRTVLAANSAMVRLYWDIGRMILERQERAGWGGKVIDRLAADLREAFPDMKGFSPRNLLFMRGFAEACPDWEKVKQLVSQLGDAACRDATEGLEGKPSERGGDRGGDRGAREAAMMKSPRLVGSEHATNRRHRVKG